MTSTVYIIRFHPKDASKLDLEEYRNSKGSIVCQRQDNAEEMVKALVHEGYTVTIESGTAEIEMPKRFQRRGFPFADLSLSNMLTDYDGNKEEAENADRPPNSGTETGSTKAPETDR